MESIKKVLEWIVLIVLWIVLCRMLVVLLPFILFMLIVRTTESLIFRWKYNAEKLRSDDILYMMNKEENRLIITGIMQVDGCFETTRLCARLQELLFKQTNADKNRSYERATKHIYPGYINYYWIEDENFDIESHVFQHSQDPVKSEEELKALIGSYCSRPFYDEFKRSPWEFILIPYEVEPGIRKTIIFYRLAHVIADGSALAYFLINGLGGESSENKEIKIKKFSQIDHTFMTMISIWRLPLVYLRLTFSLRDRNSLRISRLSGFKNVSWSDKPLDLRFIKGIKNYLSTTVNDVLIGVLTHSIQEYLKRDGSPETECRKFSAIIPVDTRTKVSDASYFDNCVAGILVELPIMASNIQSTIKETKKLFDNIKHGAEPLSMRIGWKFISFLLPMCVSKVFVFSMLDKSTAIISNLIGPQHDIFIDGHLIEYITFFPPQTNNETMGISFCSYNGSVWIGIETDSALKLCPNEIVNIFEKNMSLLTKTLL